jgi:exosortase
MQTTEAGDISKTGVTREPRVISDMNWRRIVPIGIATALLCWLYLPTFRWWYGMWTTEESYYSHGIIVPFISGFIVWQNWKSLVKIRLLPSKLGLLALVPVLSLAILASWASAYSISGMTFPLVVASLSLALLGRDFTREIAFPIGYLYFMCVLPSFLLTAISFRIQILSTAGGALLLKLMGFNAIREGTIITLPHIDVLVGSPCSGFRLLISLFAVSVLFAYLADASKWSKALIIALTIPLSILLNCVRIALIAIVGEFRGEQAMHVFHDWSGYIVLAIAFLIFFLLSRLLGCREFRFTRG